MLENITRILQSIDGSGAFASRETTTPEDLRLEVKDVGAIRLPVTPAQARKLCRIARPARFGSRDRTLMDKGVRDTWEIARSRVKIDQRRWKQTLELQLENIRANLGLPTSSRLEAQLYKLLVYEPGQFFVPHRDSERADDMIGTLAVVLPSTYTGGTEVIEHRGEKVTYRRTSRSAKSLTFIAFYADCHHEVRPVKEGFRVVLVYNLFIRETGTSHLQLQDAGVIDLLAKDVAAYFEAPVAEYRWRAPEPPEKLVYLLDHDYTQRSLAWHRLKSVDALRTSGLRAVAASPSARVAPSSSCSPSTKRSSLVKWSSANGKSVSSPGSSGSEWSSIEPAPWEPNWSVEGPMDVETWAAAGLAGTTGVVAEVC